MKKMSNFKSILAILFALSILSTGFTAVAVSINVSDGPTYTFDNLAATTSADPNAVVSGWETYTAFINNERLNSDMRITDMPVAGNPDNKVLEFYTKRMAADSPNGYAPATKIPFWGNQGWVATVDSTVINAPTMLTLGGKFKVNTADLRSRHFTLALRFKDSPTTEINVLQFVYADWNAPPNAIITSGGVTMVQKTEFIPNSWYTLNATFDPRDRTKYTVVITDETGAVFTATPTVNLAGNIKWNEGEIVFKIRNDDLNNDGGIFRGYVDDFYIRTRRVYNYSTAISGLVDDYLIPEFKLQPVAFEAISTTGVITKITDGKLPASGKVRTRIDIDNFCQPWDNGEPNAILMTALYKGNEIVSINACEKPIYYGVHFYHVDTEIPQDIDSTYTLKTFTWSGSNGIKPLSSTVPTLVGE